LGKSIYSQKVLPTIQHYSDLLNILDHLDKQVAALSQVVEAEAEERVEVMLLMQASWCGSGGLPALSPRILGWVPQG